MKGPSGIEASSRQSEINRSMIGNTPGLGIAVTIPESGSFFIFAVALWSGAREPECLRHSFMLFIPFRSSCSGPWKACPHAEP